MTSCSSDDVTQAAAYLGQESETTPKKVFDEPHSTSFTAEEPRINGALPLHDFDESSVADTSTATVVKGKAFCGA